MDLSQTRQLARLMNAHHRNKEARFAVGPDQARRGRLEGFHPWVEGRAVFGAWRVAAPSGRSLELLLIDWAEKETGYLVVYPANRTGPILEAHRIEETRRRSHLCWRYTPFKRDGRNADVVVEWMRDAGALALGAERNGRRARSILYVWDEPGGRWVMMGGESELYDDLVVVLTEYLYPEVRGA